MRRLQRLDPGVREGQLSVDVSVLSHVDVDQFYGIEYEEFPARIAEVAMYLMDHLANQELSQEFGLSYARIPLHTPPNIHVANALRTDWNTVLAADECSYLLGNPPFVAKKRRNVEQVEDMERIFGGRTVLDYVSAWFAKAAEYIQGQTTRAAFVATNSIVQGEQVTSALADLARRRHADRLRAPKFPLDQRSSWPRRRLRRDRRLQRRWPSESEADLRLRAGQCRRAPRAGCRADQSLPGRRARQRHPQALPIRAAAGARHPLRLDAQRRRSSPA